MVGAERRDRHLNRWASRLSATDADRFFEVVKELRRRFARYDYRSTETYSLSTEFERLCAKSRCAPTPDQSGEADKTGTGLAEGESGLPRKGSSK